MKLRAEAEEYSLRDLSNIKGAVLERVQTVKDTGVKITKAELEAMRLNSYERKYILGYVDDEAFLWQVEIALNNSGARVCRNSIPVTYDDWLKIDGIYGLLARYYALSDEVKRLREEKL